jgi:hypothetical protein
MECFRRAIIPEQTFEGRSDSLTQANKVSRTYGVLLDALNRHRGKGEQKVVVEHVHVHSGGQESRLPSSMPFTLEPDKFELARPYHPGNAASHRRRGDPIAVQWTA